MSNVSATNSPLIFWSNGESHAKEGERFTSISQGLYAWSIKISNPKISKHDEEFLYETFLRYAFLSGGSAAITALITKSSIFSEMESQSKHYINFEIYYNKEYK